MLYCGYDNFTGEEDDLMQDRKLEQALEIYFQENPDRESDKYQEIQKYLKLRIRSVMELRSLVWLLHLKDKKYGYPKKDFSL